MPHTHTFETAIRWTGNTGAGNASYRGYARTWDIVSPGKAVVHCSNDPMLGGDAGKHNPEDLLINALSACHMLWYLHLAFEAGVLVTAYEDRPIGIGESDPSGAGRFVRAILQPHITLGAGVDEADADAVHDKIHKVCFIARSVAFPIEINAVYINA